MCTNANNRNNDKHKCRQAMRNTKVEIDEISTNNNIDFKIIDNENVNKSVVLYSKEKRRVRSFLRSRKN
jgi:hypothetical protein